MPSLNNSQRVWCHQTLRWHVGVACMDWLITQTVRSCPTFVQQFVFRLMHAFSSNFPINFVLFLYRISYWPFGFSHQATLRSAWLAELMQSNVPAASVLACKVISHSRANSTYQPPAFCHADCRVVQDPVAENRRQYDCTASVEYTKRAWLHWVRPNACTVLVGSTNLIEMTRTAVA